MKKKVTKSSKDKGGFLPPEKDFYKVAREEYNVNPPQTISNFELVYKSPTIHVYINKAGKTILLSFRGMRPTDTTDLSAIASIPINRLFYSTRFKKDKEQIQKIFEQYPPNQYEYYITGHSLGGAVTNSIVREFPKNIKYAVTYNPAFQPYDVISQQKDKIKRIYTKEDPLYKLGGHFFNPTIAPTTKSLSSGTDTVSNVYNAYQGHGIENFAPYYGLGKGGRKSKKLIGGAGEIVEKERATRGKYAFFRQLQKALAKSTPEELINEFYKGDIYQVLLLFNSARLQNVSIRTAITLWLEMEEKNGDMYWEEIYIRYKDDPKYYFYHSELYDRNNNFPPDFILDPTTKLVKRGAEYFKMPTKEEAVEWEKSHTGVGQGKYFPCSCPYCN